MGRRRLPRTGRGCFMVADFRLRPHFKGFIGLSAGRGDYGLNDHPTERNRVRSSAAFLDDTSGGARESLALFLGADPRPGNAFRLLPYIGSAAAVAVTLACGVLIERFIGLQSVLLVFLLAILASAILWGLLPSLFACVLSVLAFNFFL